MSLPEAELDHFVSLFVEHVIGILLLFGCSVLHFELEGEVIVVVAKETVQDDFLVLFEDYVISLDEGGEEHELFRW